MKSDESNESRLGALLMRFGWIPSVLAALVAVVAVSLRRPVVSVTPVASDPESLNESMQQLLARTDDLRGQIAEMQQSAGLTFSSAGGWPEQGRIDQLAKRIEEISATMQGLERQLEGGDPLSADEVEALSGQWLGRAAVSRDLIEREKSDVRNPGLDARSRAAALDRLHRLLGDDAAIELAPLIDGIVRDSTGLAEEDLALVCGALTLVRQGVVIPNEKEQLMRLLTRSTLPGVREECVRGLEKYASNGDVKQMLESLAVRDPARSVRRAAEDALGELPR